MAEGVAVHDRAGRPILLNPALERLVGRFDPSSAGDVGGHQLGRLLIAGDEQIPEPDLPTSRALRGESSDEVELVVHPPDSASPGFWP